MYAKTHCDVPLSDADLVAERKKIVSAVTEFSLEMQAAMNDKLRAGWRGWDDPANRQEIWNALLAHASGVPHAVGQEVAIANFAMFLWWHRRPPADTAAEQAAA